MLFPALTQAGVPVPAERDGSTLSLHLDNDLYVGQDRDYTNGARLSWISEALASVGSDQAGGLQYHYGMSLTQLIFTPEDYLASHQPPGERRYAGWLGLGFSLHAKGEQALNSIELTLGTTGPNSFAEDAQNAVHEIRNIEKFNGWADQIPSELTLDVSFTQKRRRDFGFLAHGDFSMDGAWEWSARLGSFRTSAHLGASLRGGFHLMPDMSDQRLSEIAFSHRHAFAADPAASHWSAYFFSGTVVRGIAHDATLDGPLFQEFETGNTREPWVVEAFLGIALACGKVELSYVHTWRSKEYEEQNGISEFGSVGLRFRF